MSRHQRVLKRPIRTLTIEKSFLKNESRVNLTLTIFSVCLCSEVLFSQSDHILILGRPDGLVWFDVFRFI